VQVGLAYCDNTLKVIGVVEFLDGDQLCNLEAALVRLGARECVAVEDKGGGAKSVENKKIKEVLQRCDVVLTQRKSSDFATKDIEQDLARLVNSQKSARYSSHNAALNIPVCAGLENSPGIYHSESNVCSLL